jgi:hypothetical protein
MLDWFVTQRLSIPDIVSRASGREQELFARVSYSTASNIILRIDRDHLCSAIAAWRAFDAEMRSWGLKPDSAHWSAITAAVLRLPNAISLQLLRPVRAPIAQSIWRVFCRARVQGSRVGVR